jgi:hypothetical protein
MEIQNGQKEVYRSSKFQQDPTTSNDNDPTTSETVHWRPCVDGNISTTMSTDFSSCTLLPIPSEESSSCSVVLSPNGKFITSSFYLDSSGRACISLPLELTFPSEDVLNAYLAKDCFDPKPINYEKADDSEGKEAGPENEEESSAQQNQEIVNKSSICIEAKVALTFGTGEAIIATVEAVKLLSIKLQGVKSLIFETDIIVRVSRGAKIGARISDPSVKANLEVAAVLSEKIAELDSTTTALAALSNLNLVGGVPANLVQNHRRVRFVRTNPFTLHASLTQALTVSVKSVTGPFMGQTFLALTIRHSGTHSEPVTVTRIALHPSHSQEKNEDNQESQPAEEVLDTTKLVQWGYSLRSDPNLPVTLNSHEAFSTVLTVEASQDSQCRTYVCPVSVTAVLGRKEDTHRYQVIADADAEWTTSKAATSDGFHLDLSLGERVCRVGAPMTVQIKVRNLSMDTKDLMLLVDNDKESMENPSTNGGHKKVEEKDQFGVEGLSVVDKNSPSELISLDVAYLLGVLEGQATADASLRFIPLREGSITIPNLQIVDRKSGRKYVCFHKLRATVGSAE